MRGKDIPKRRLIAKTKSLRQEQAWCVSGTEKRPMSSRDGGE